MRFLATVFVGAVLCVAQPPPLGQLVKIGHRNIHIHCMGEGGPTVVFVNGVPRFSVHFALLQAATAGFARACVYDRAGEAWSDPLPGAPTAEGVLDELRGVIAHVGAGKPVILAGHSFGGVIATAYQKRYTHEIAGLVLIDSVPPDLAIMKIGDQRKKFSELTEQDIAAIAEQARARPKPEIRQPQMESPFDHLPAILHSAHLWATAKWQESAVKIPVKEATRFQTEFYRMIQDPAFGDMPVVFVTRAAASASQDPWMEAQEKLAASAPNGKLVRAVDSGHDIELEQPATVANAIREIALRVAAARVK